tara:strand:- start:109 stop:507 length:399 start_codon:yes stop_codon:yes gene_type:complete
MNKANAQTGGVVTFHNSSWHNDACGSIMFELSNIDETYVQLFAFENDDDMKAEGFEHRFAVTIHNNGEFNEALHLVTNDENLAIVYAVQHAKHLKRGGFEHEGVWIEDSTKSPCGRFDLTPEQQREIYGDRS